MDRAFVGDFQQAMAGGLIQVSDNVDLALNAIHLARRGMAIGAVFGVNFVVPEGDRDVFQRDFFVFGVHSQGHVVYL